MGRKGVAIGDKKRHEMIMELSKYLTKDQLELVVFGHTRWSNVHMELLLKAYQK